MTTADRGRLWFQGLVPHTEQSQAYFDARAAHAAALPTEMPKVEFRTVPAAFFPPGLTPADLARTEAGDLLYELLIADAAMTAETEGYSAFAIGVIQDTGLRVARAVTDIPVAGYGQAAALLGRAIGFRIGVIAFNPRLFPLISRRLNAHVPGIVVGVEDIALAYDDVLQSFTEPHDAAILAERVSEAANHLGKEGADVLIPGQMLLSEAVHHIGLQEVNGVPVIDGLTVTVALAHSLITLRQQTGPTTRNTASHTADTAIGNMLAQAARTLTPAIPG